MSPLIFIPAYSCFQGIILKGWIDLTSNKEAYAKKSGKYFDEGLKENSSILGLMGKVGSSTIISGFLPKL